jgi:hypothetical protein
MSYLVRAFHLAYAFENVLEREGGASFRNAAEVV